MGVCANGDGLKQNRRRTLLGIHDLFSDHITNCVVRFRLFLNEITACKAGRHPIEHPSYQNEPDRVNRTEPNNRVNRTE